MTGSPSLDQPAGTEGRGSPFRKPSLRHVALAAFAGALATFALLQSPIFGNVPPIVPPYVPIDLRIVLLPITFALTQALAPSLDWPGRGVATLGLAVSTAVAAHVHASAALDFVGLPWAAPGTRVDLIGLGASLGSILSALVVTLETGRDRFSVRLRERGVPEAEIETARELGDQLIASSLTTAGLAIAVLALALRIVDRFVGGESLPIPEVLALALVLGLGAVLLGVRGQEDVPE